MSNLQIIEALCQLVESQSGVISRLAMELYQIRALTDAESEMIATVQQKYSAILGADEAPDFLQD